MDINLPDFDRTDHREHFVVGAGIGALSVGGLLLVKPHASPTERFLVSTLSSATAGVIKEALDSRDPAHHTTETGDAISTALGGVATGLSFSFVFRF